MAVCFLSAFLFLFFFLRDCVLLHWYNFTPLDSIRDRSCLFPKYYETNAPRLKLPILFPAGRKNWRISKAEPVPLHGPDLRLDLGRLGVCLRNLGGICLICGLCDGKIAFLSFLTIRLLFAVQAASHTAVAESQTRGRDDTFDYVVVGGRAAGLALASRLAEDFSRTVAVIEAGGFYEPDNGNISIVPAYCTIGAGTDPADFNPLVDWGFVTQPLKVYHSLPHNTSPSLTMQ